MFQEDSGTKQITKLVSECVNQANVPSTLQEGRLWAVVDRVRHPKHSWDAELGFNIM